MDSCEYPSASVSNDTDNKGDSWAQFWDIQGVAAYITARNFTIVTLQFPDDLLREAKDVSKAVQDACARHKLQVKVIPSIACWDGTVPYACSCNIDLLPDNQSDLFVLLYIRSTL